MEKRFWPFPLAKPESEWNDIDRDLVDFMRIAYTEGYQPYYGPGMCVSVGTWGKGDQQASFSVAAAMDGSRSSANRCGRSGSAQATACHSGNMNVFACGHRFGMRP